MRASWRYLILLLGVIIVIVTIAVMTDGLGWDIAVYALLTVPYIGALIVYMLKVGPYRYLDQKKRRLLRLSLLASGLVIIYMTVNLIQRLLA